MNIASFVFIPPLNMNILEKIDELNPDAILNLFFFMMGLIIGFMVCVLFYTFVVL